VLQCCTGWILDTFIEYGQPVLWIKCADGQTHRVVAKYGPTLFLLPKNEQAGSELIQILSDLELVKHVGWDYKFNDINHTILTKLIYVQCYSIHHYNLLLKALQHEMLCQRIQKTYNTKLSHLYRYIFENLPNNPMAKIVVEHDNGDLISISRSNDHETLGILFSLMYVNVNPTYSQGILDGDDPIESIRVKIQDETIDFTGHESDLLQQFSIYTINKDPDIIVFNYESITALNYLLHRVRSLSLDVPLGRRKVDIYFNDARIVSSWSQGRIYLHDKQIEMNGLEGLIELSYFSGLPISIISGQSIGRLIATRNIRELLSRDYAISDSNNRPHYEQIRTVEDIIQHDKAGMIFSPKVGLHENIAVLDYNDEFANIIVNQNISYEKQEKDNLSLGILPQIVKSLVERRIYFRNLLKQSPNDSIEAAQYENRADIIKQILVCLYGTTGSYWNKYGNTSAFEEINKNSREILLGTKEIVQEHGYELVYADTDACFVHKDRATKDDYDKLGSIISKETGLAICLEYHYKFLVLLPLEAHEQMEALKHYFGITYDGQLVMRGIETRRHDTPLFIREFQTKLLNILFDCNKSEDIYNKTLEMALYYLTTFIDKVMTDEIDTKDLVISKQLRMDITKYRNIFPHVAAAIQLGNNGKLPARGEVVQYVYTDSQHQNPMSRVTTQIESESIYDKEKYKEMLLDAAETVLAIFGFDRTLYGKPKDKKWWMELRRNRMRDIDAEVAR
jgi:DNA polymerase elongation subunit (family B)